MSKSKLKVAVGPLTNTIFAGWITKDGIRAAGKEDVTVDCPVAVAEHIEEFGKPVEIKDGRQGRLL